MQVQSGFTLLELHEFKSWLMKQQVIRNVHLIQNHHTWVPSYKHFEDRGHFPLLESMKNVHVGIRGWSDIGQHFTIFPDGRIGTGRPLGKNPACISGKNDGAICIENLGDFDEGKDEMTQEQKESIIHVNAMLNVKFGLRPGLDNNVYHHWFSAKTCPGTAFFGGNTRVAAEANFIPLVNTEWEKIKSSLNELPQGESEKRIGNALVLKPDAPVRMFPLSFAPVLERLSNGVTVPLLEQKGTWYKVANPNQWVAETDLQPYENGVVIVSVDDVLNVRSGPGIQFDKVRELTNGAEIRVYEKENSWYKIELNDFWVSGKFIRLID